jgi:hypothetical protein
MDNQNLQKRIESLEKQMLALQNSSTIPFNVVRSLSGRGFVLQNEFFVAGEGTFSFGGTFRSEIPGATEQSIVLITPYTTNVSTSVAAQIVPSTTFNGYDLYAEGTANDNFSFVVFLFNNLFNQG